MVKLELVMKLPSGFTHVVRQHYLDRYNPDNLAALVDALNDQQGEKEDGVTKIYWRAKLVQVQTIEEVATVYGIK